MHHEIQLMIGFFAASFASIFAIANPFGTMAVFASMTEDYSRKDKLTTAKKTARYMVIILGIFLIAGTSIQNFFGISLAGIRVAGGLIILQSAFAMVNPSGAGRKRISEAGVASAKAKKDISFTPLAMPMLSGPGSIAVVIGLAAECDSLIDFGVVMLAIIATAILSYLILRLGIVSSKLIGAEKMEAITKMMGFIVMAIAIQFILSGIKQFYGL